MSIENNIARAITIAALVGTAACSDIRPAATAKPSEILYTQTWTPEPGTLVAPYTTPGVIGTATETTTPSPTHIATSTPPPTEDATLTKKETEHFTTPKILLLGDSMFSITKIPTFLSDLLIDAEIPADFVGDKISFDNDVPTDGLGGFDTLLMLRQLTRETVWTELNGTQFPNNLSEHIPDIVFIQLGTNDAINSTETKSDPAPEYKKNMQQIIEFLRSKNPSVKIVIPMLIPSEDKSYDAKITLINDAIPDFVQSMNRQNSPVVTTQDLRGGWKIEDFRDNVHPSTFGQKKIAEADFDALVGSELIIVRTQAIP